MSDTRFLFPPIVLPFLANPDLSMSAKDSLVCERYIYRPVEILIDHDTFSCFPLASSNSVSLLSGILKPSENRAIRKSMTMPADIQVRRCTSRYKVN